MRFRVIVSDPPWNFSDRLTMADVKRGASSNYAVLKNSVIKSLDVKSIAMDDAILALWCPSSLLDVGLEVMHEWGFEFKQTHIWVKTKKKPFAFISKLKEFLFTKETAEDLNSCLAFGMGRLFRQTHEIALIGTRGKIYQHLKDKSQRSVHFYVATRHSEKPENLQDMLDKMFDGPKLEMFARRSRPGWECVGLECSPSEDIRIALERLKGKIENSTSG